MLVRYSSIMLLLCCLPLVAGCGNAQLEEQCKKATSQVGRWADKLDSQTTKTGVYIKHPQDDLPENDPWGHPLKVTYSQGGVSEMLVVRSLGPDGLSHTVDDITAQRTVVNFKGIGEGIKENAGKTTKKAARGLIDGVKEGVKGVVKKDKPEEEN